MSERPAKSGLMRKATAESIRDGKGWYWPVNARKAHYYLADNRSACGRYMVLVLPTELEGFDSKLGPDDCAGCRAKVEAAQARLKLDANVVAEVAKRTP